MNSVNATRRGFTLVELMIAVAIVSILATLAIFGVKKYVNNSKTVEARNALGQMSKDVATAFLAEKMVGTVLTLGSTAVKSNALCPSGPRIPSGIASVQGRKYQSSPTEWNAGWLCMRFSMQDPQYYQYEYTLVGDGVTPNNNSFALTARGDLDADNNTSTFQYNGALIADATSIAVILGANIDESKGDE